MGGLLHEKSVDGPSLGAYETAVPVGGRSGHFAPPVAPPYGVLPELNPLYTNSGHLSLSAAHAGAAALVKKTFWLGVLTFLINMLLAGSTLGIFNAVFTGFYIALLYTVTTTGEADSGAALSHITPMVGELILFSICSLIVELFFVLMGYTIILLPLVLLVTVFTPYVYFNGAARKSNYFRSFADSWNMVRRNGFCLHFGAWAWTFFLTSIFVIVVVIFALVIVGIIFGSHILSNQVGEFAILLVAYFGSIGTIVIFRFVSSALSIVLQSYVLAFHWCMFLQVMHKENKLGEIFAATTTTQQPFHQEVMEANPQYCPPMHVVHTGNEENA